MKISVIIPTYNRASFLSKTIDSILNQTVKVDEIIVVDDGSTDDTQSILNSFTNIKYIKQTNQGVSKARNIGIQNSTNNWICFLDSDDIWHDTKIEKQIEFHITNKDILFSHTNERWLFNNKLIKQKKHQQKPSGYCFKQNVLNTLIGASTVMIHKSLFENIGYFDEDLTVCEDYDLWLRILYKYKLGYIDEKLIDKIAGHKEQLSFTTPLMDTYRIQALLKHKDSKYQEIIKDEIIKKSEILIAGAIKHKNKQIEDYYRKLLDANFR